MRWIAASGLACCLFLGSLEMASAQKQKKDYLSRTEADKVRDANTPADRIKLFISFAADRIQKFQYELEHPENVVRPVERVNNLINNYTNCLDDAADLIDLGAEKQQDIRESLKSMQMQGAMFLEYLKGLSSQGGADSPYKESLDDAIEATQDAIKSADEAAKTIAPPVRRKQA